MKDCCEGNRGEPERLSDDMVVRVCSVCGAKHYELTVLVGEAASEGADV